MSSNLKNVKVCAYCKREFMASMTTTETCSDPLAKRSYKVRQREMAAHRAEVKAIVKREPQSYTTREQVKILQTKQRLTLNEAVLLINVSPLTLRRWVLAPKVTSVKNKEESICPRE